MKNLPRLVLTRPTYFLALGFGSGLLPIAPGTFATLLAIPFYYFLSALPLSLYSAIVVAAFLMGVWVCGKVAKELKGSDPSQIVWDEIVGYWVTMFMIPPDAVGIILGFILFRFFDILKPWPIRWVEKRYKGGFGIMVDDLIAGICATLILHAVLFSSGL